MKKNIIITATIIISLMITNFKIHAQGGAANNQPTFGSSNTLGWLNSGTAADQDLPIDNQLNNKNIIFKTNNTGTNGSSTTKMTIIGSSGSTSGYVGIGIVAPTNLVTISSSGGTGTGATPTVPPLLVVGGGTGSSARDQLAQFRSSSATANSVGISIRGSRSTGTGTDFDAAFIDLLNWDNGSTQENRLARISGDQRSYSNRSGYLRFYTNNTSNVLKSAMMIDNDGSVGIGSDIFMASQSPARRLEIYDNSGFPQVRVSETISATATSCVYTDLQTTSSGDFYIHPVTSGAADGNVGIGTSSPTARLEVDNSTNLISVYGINTKAGSGFQDVIGVRGESTGSTSFRNMGGQFVAGGAGTVNIGVNGFCEIPVNGVNTGGSFRGDNAGTNYGVVGLAGTASTIVLPTTGSSIGGTFVAGTGSSSNLGSFSSVSAPAAIPSGANIGGYFYSTGNTNSVNVYAVYATVDNPCTATSSTNCNNLAGYFNGAIVTTLGSFTTSDAQFKTNVQDVQNALQIIDQLQPKTYDFDQSYLDKINLPEGNHFGFIANDVALVLPGTVKEVVHPETIDTLGNVTPAINYTALNYDELIPILTAAIKELKAQVDILQSGARNANPGSANQLEVKLADKSIVVLEQNLPNPWKENTTINFNIPDDVKQAQILFYNSKGNVISTVEITERGAGSLLVYGADLTSGVYTYTLLIDHTPLETKKMIKVK